MNKLNLNKIKVLTFSIILIVYLIVFSFKGFSISNSYQFEQKSSEGIIVLFAPKIEASGYLVSNELLENILKEEFNKKIGNINHISYSFFKEKKREDLRLHVKFSSNKGEKEEIIWRDHVQIITENLKIFDNQCLELKRSGKISFYRQSYFFDMGLNNLTPSINFKITIVRVLVMVLLLSLTFSIITFIGLSYLWRLIKD